MYKTKETAIKHLQMGEKFKSNKFDLFRDDKDVVFEVIKMGVDESLIKDSFHWNDKSFVLRVLKEECYKYGKFGRTSLWYFQETYIPIDILKIAPREVYKTEQYIEILEKTIAMEKLQAELKPKVDDEPRKLIKI